MILLVKYKVFLCFPPLRRPGGIANLWKILDFTRKIMKNHRRDRKKNFPCIFSFEILFMIIVIHNLAENRQTGMGNRYLVSDLVPKSLTPGSPWDTSKEFVRLFRTPRVPQGVCQRPSPLPTTAQRLRAAPTTRCRSKPENPRDSSRGICPKPLGGRWERRGTPEAAECGPERWQTPWVT